MAQFGGKILLFTSLLFLTACMGGSLNSASTDQSLLVNTEISTFDYDANSTKAIITAQIGDPKQVLPLHQVRFFSTDACVDPVLGEGLVQKLVTDGIEFSAPLGETVNIYFQLNTDSKCHFFSKYESNIELKPTVTFERTVPASPSATSFQPAIFGNLFPSSGTVELFSDNQCLVPIGTASRATFLNTGVQLSLTAEMVNMIYAKAKDLLGQESSCSHFATYAHSTTSAIKAQFHSANPASPSNTLENPLIRGILDASITQVYLYSDSACTSQIGNGTAAVFSSSGLPVAINENSTNHIYARTHDGQSLDSTCIFLTSYVHDSVAPNPPVFVSADPVSPTRTTTFPKIKGTAPSDAQIVRLYNSATCLATKVIGWNTRAQFEGLGINANLLPNMTTAISAATVDAAGNISSCVHLTDYRHNTIPPADPVFAGTIPVSPTNQSITPLIQGYPSENTNILNFYSDDQCQVLIGSGSAADFEQTGIQVTVTANTTSSIYASAQDIEGNNSECLFMSSYLHSTQPANNVGFSLAFPASPTRVTANPFIVGTADSTIVSVEIFADSSCTTSLGSGTRISFVTAGIQIAVPTDASTELFARSTNVYGNFSTCATLTHYTHTTQPPLSPTLTLVAPVSPNNITNQPVITGNSFQNPASPIPPTRVVFYDSDACVANIGEGNPAQYSGAGIQITLPENAVSTVYARSFDAAFNASPCTHMTDYAYSNLKPGRPIHVLATPNTPSYVNTTSMRGSYGASTDFMAKVSVEFYTDSGCTALLTTGSPTQYTTTGIQMTVGLNATTPIYARTFNEVGTASDCTLLINYLHSNAGPANPAVIQNSNGSLRVNWLPDLIANPVPRYIVKRALNSNGPYTVVASDLATTLFTDNNVVHNSTYYYRVQATNSTGSSLDSVEVSRTVNAPTPVQPLTLTANPGPNEINLTWSGFVQNMVYKIEKKEQTSGSFSRLPISLTGTNYSDYSVVDGTVYIYRVVGINPQGESTYSNEISTASLEVPPAISNIWISPQLNTPACGGGTGVHIFWSPSSYSHGYEVWRETIGSALLATVSQNEHVDCNPAGNINRYSIATKWGSITSSQSVQANFRNDGALPLFVYPGHNHILLNWGSVGTSNAYDIFRSSVATGPFEKIVSNHGTTSYTDSTVLNGQARYYIVQAKNGATMMGWPSAPMGGTAAPNPLAPTNLIIENSGTSVRLHWTPSTHFNRFIIYRASDIGGPYVAIDYATNPTYLDISPASGMNYYQVSAQWGNSQTSGSNIAEYRHSVVTGLSLTRGPSELSLNWSDYPGVLDYRVERAESQLGPYSSIAFPSSSDFIDNTAVAGVGYYYRIKARFADATEGQPSSVVSGMLTGTVVPTGLSALMVSASSVTVGWVTVPGATQYRVRRATNVGGPYNQIAVLGSGSNSYAYVSLSSQTNYYFRVGAMVSGIEQMSATLNVATLSKPDAPVGDLGNNEIDVQWSPLPGVLSYSLERSVDRVNFSSIATGLASSSYLDTGLTNGQIYFYRVTANFTLGSVASDISLGLSPGVVPLSPQGLHIDDNSIGTSISLGWTPVTGATGYYIYMSTTQGGPYGAPYMSTIATSNVAVSGLTPGQAYYFVVTTRRGNTISANSSEASAIASSTPAAPTAVYQSATEISLNWSPVPGASAYNLERSEDGFIFYEIATGLVTTSYVDNSFAGNRSYRYRFKPIHPSGADISISGTSNSVFTGTSPLAPIGFLVEGQGLTAAKLSWVTVPETTQYQVFRSTTSGSGHVLVQTVPAPTTTWTDTGLTSGISYFYYVRALNSSGVPSPNSVEKGVVLSAAPAGFMALNNGSQIDLSWTALGGAVRYHVYRADQAGGPYQWLKDSLTTNASDTSAVPYRTYYYVLTAEFASGLPSIPSSEINILKTGSLKFQIPVELIDRGLASRSTESRTFERSRTRIDSNQFDGVVSSSFELVASNMEPSSRDIELLDSSLNPLATVTVPAFTNQPTRFEVSFVLPGGISDLRIRVEQTTNPETVMVYSARALISQENATKTAIYYPLAASAQIPTSDDELGAVVATNDSSYQSLEETMRFRRTVDRLSRIREYNAWRLDALVIGDVGVEGSFQFKNMTSDQVVGGTQTLIQSDQIRLAQAEIDEGIAQFGNGNEGHLYEIQMRCLVNCLSGQVKILKAGIWVHLENLTKLEIPYRVSLGTQMINSNVDIFEGRVRIDLNRFSNPQFFYQVTASTVGGLSDLVIGTVGVSDSSTSVTDLAPSQLSFMNGSSKETQVTFSPMTINDDERLVMGLRPQSGSVKVHSGLLLIRMSQ